MVAHFTPPCNGGPPRYVVRLVAGPDLYEMPHAYTAHPRAARAARRALALARRLVGRAVAEARVLAYRGGNPVVTVRYLSPATRTGGRP